jgi:hypothetical protein
MLLRDPPQNPFSTVSVMNGLKADVRVESVPLPTPDIGALGQKVAFVPIVLQKSFCTGDQKFSGL